MDFFFFSSDKLADNYLFLMTNTRKVINYSYYYMLGSLEKQLLRYKLPPIVSDYVCCTCLLENLTRGQRTNLQFVSLYAKLS